jgi:lysyl endopeptidase
MQSKMANRFITAFSGMVLATILGATTAIAAGSAPSVEGEYLKPSAAATKAAAQLPLKGTLDMQSDFASMELPAMDAAKIEAAKKSNSVGGTKKSMQIGIARSMRDELPKASASPTLRWKSIATGGKVAYLRIKSTDAKAIRVGLNVSGAPDGLELRFVGSNNPNQVVALASAGELSTLKDDKGIYWTPMTEGQFQTIEISLPAGADAAAFKFTVDSVSHIFATPALKFSDAKSVSDCNVDVVCAPQVEGLVNAKNSVAHMTFQSDCGPNNAIGTCICTGTLIADNDPTSQIPYFFGANHCIGTQSVANTLNTYWFFENPTCQNPRTFDVNRSIGTLVSGGAALLYADRNSDGALFQLNRAPPAGAFLLGWDANPISAGENVTMIHHPDGDPKRISLAVVNNILPSNGVLPDGGRVGLSGSFIIPRYTTGTALGGSSGAGILTPNGSQGNYLLRGGLFGGAATCENRTLTASEGNYDIYSRFDLIFPSIRQFIFKDTTATNYTDIWWGGAAESGWGIQITQHPSNNIFATWYTYDQSGNQLFIIMSGCDLIPFNGSACGGRLYRTTGTPFNTPTFVGANVTQIGTGTFTFTDANNAVFDYTIAASASNATTSIRKFITRFPFGAGFATFPSDNSDIYYKSDASGWGYSLAQHGNESFGVIYHYDENRNPMFLTMYMPNFNNTSGGAATLFRTRSNGGSHFLTPTWRSSDISNVPVSGAGNASVSVVPGGLNLTFTVNSNGNNFTQTRALTRVPF